MPTLVANALSKEFAGVDGPLGVFRDVSISLEPGESLAIVGPSGSGKSTLLHLLGTLDRPTSGSLILNDIDPFELDAVALARFRNQHLGFVFQEHYLLPQLTLEENVLLPTLAFQGNVAQEQQQRAAHLIDRVGLSDRRGHRPAQLSGGERQRAAIARAMIMRPKILLADEPTGNLDQENAMATAEMLAELSNDDSDEQQVLVLVTHNPEVARCLGRTMMMANHQLTPLTSTGSA